MFHLRILLIIAFSLFPGYSFCQDITDNKPAKKAVLETDVSNVIYIGINNKFRVSVPSALKVKVTGEHILPADIDGYYKINISKECVEPVYIEAEMTDGSLYKETRELHIQKPGDLNITLNGLDRILEISKKELENKIIGIVFSKCSYDLKFRIKSFFVLNPTKRVVEIQGDSFNQNAMKVIENLKPGDEFYIVDAAVSSGYCESCLFHPRQLKIILTK